MKVVCDQCAAVYNVPNARLTKPINKATCRQCNSRLLIPRPQPGADEDERLIVPAVPPAGETGASSPATSGMGRLPLTPAPEEDADKTIPVVSTKRSGAGSSPQGEQLNAEDRARLARLSSAGGNDHTVARISSPPVVVRRTSGGGAEAPPAAPSASLVMNARALMAASGILAFGAVLLATSGGSIVDPVGMVGLFFLTTGVFLAMFTSITSDFGTRPMHPAGSASGALVLGAAMAVFGPIIASGLSQDPASGNTTTATAAVTETTEAPASTASEEGEKPEGDQSSEAAEAETEAEAEAEKAPTEATTPSKPAAVEPAPKTETRSSAPKTTARATTTTPRESRGRTSTPRETTRSAPPAPEREVRGTSSQSAAVATPAPAPAPRPAPEPVRQVDPNLPVQVPPAVVKTILTSNQGVKMCFYEGLKGGEIRKPVTVTTRFKLSASGRASGTRVLESSLQGSGIERCLASAISRATFPPAQEDTSVTYPFKL
ncbi:MAG: hypothetical protein ACON5B_03585 [Myxococcota bacterium]